MAQTHDFLFKVLLTGDSDVGKTELLFRLADDAFNTGFLSNIGIDFKIRTIELEGKKIKLQMWDTAGQERYRTINYRGAMGIILVYDITNDRSFEKIKKWARNIEEHMPSDVVKMLLGNKCHMEDRRVVSKERGTQLAAEFGMEFLEVSASHNINVDEAVDCLARAILKVQQRKLGPHDTLGT